MWVGGDAIMALVLLTLALQVIRGTRPMDNPRWIEQVRAQTLLGSTEPTGRPSRNLDTDAAVLDAYNRRLAVLNQQVPDGHDGPPARQDR